MNSLLLNNSLSLIIKASGAILLFTSLLKKSKASISDLLLYLVQILIWYVSPDFIFFLNLSNIILYDFLLIFILNKLLGFDNLVFLYSKLFENFIFVSGL